jgi:hypothetical protein
VPHGLPQRAQAGVSSVFHHRARAGLAAALSLAFIAAASSPALADQARRNEWWLRTLHVTSAWQTTRGSGVTIAVLDTGVDPGQADLTGSVTTGPDYTNSGRTAAGRQFWGIHGTEVASLIAGHGHGPGQANGIIGIAPAAKVLSVRVRLESNDPQLTNQAIAAGLPNAIARGIRWAVRHNAGVIDLPLDPVTTSGASGSGGSPAERAAVAYALSRHVVVVGPAGDGGASGDPVNYPAAYHGVIAVGAFDRPFVKAPFSSHQSYVTVTAAGAGVAAAGPSGSYPLLNSTSAASAIVAGVVALIRAQFPTLTPSQVTRALTTSTRFKPPGGRADGSGFGAVDAARALTAAAGIAETVPKPAGSASTSGQAPPSPPAVHSAPIHRSIRGTLIKDAVIAGVVFLLLLGLIFGAGAWRRRHARSARLAAVRAAGQLPARQPGPPAAKKRAQGKGAAKQAAQAGGGSPAGIPATTDRPELEPAGFIAAPLGPAAGGPGPAGFTGSSAPSFTGSAAGFTGSAASFTGSGFTGSAAGFTGSASAGFAAASTPPSVPAFPDLAAAAGHGPQAQPAPPLGTASSAGPTAPHVSAAGTVPPADLAAPAAPGASTPPWARMQSDPRGAAIPDSAFPGAPAAPQAGAAAPGAAPASGAAGGNAGVSRPGSRLAQGPRQPRATQVSGRPPWEPAPEPDGELPWAQAPAPARAPGPGSLPTREQVRPELPSWEELAQEAWPGGPKSAGPHPPAPPLAETNGGPGHRAGPAVTRPARVVPAAGLVPPQPDSPEQGRPAEDRPGYRWDPSAGVEPFRAPQTEPMAAAGGPGTAAGPPPAGGASKPEGVAAVSQPGVAPAQRPSLALPRRIGSAGRQAGGVNVPGRGTGPGAGPGPGTEAAGATRAGWPGTGTSQPPFPPAPRPATDPGSPAVGQPEKGPFPRAIRPPMDPAAADASPGQGGPPSPGTSQATAGDGQAGAGRAPAGPPLAGSALPPAKPVAGTPGPGSGVPPWEITDSFLAIRATGPAAEAPAAPAAPAIPDRGTWAEGQADTESIPAVDSGAGQRSFPGANPGDSTESFPAVRSQADMEDAFRLFPPVRGTDGQPPAGGQD